MCTATFEAGRMIHPPNYNSLGCTFTYPIYAGDMIQVLMTATQDATIDPMDLEGLGATFSVMQFSLRRPKHSYGSYSRYDASHATMEMDSMTDMEGGDF